MQLEQEHLAVSGNAAPVEQPGRIYAPSIWSRAGELTLSSERRANALVLSVRGELDLASAPDLSRELHIAEGTRPERVIVDLSELEFIDSSGLHELLRAHKRACENSHRLSLRRGPRAVQRLFELSHTEHLFTFED
jgi:anti-sigma B factor antagonist